MTEQSPSFGMVAEFALPDIGEFALSLEAIAELWGRGILTHTAYVALLLTNYRDLVGLALPEPPLLADPNSRKPQTMALDVADFLDTHGYWAGRVGARIKERTLTPLDFQAAIVVLQKKGLWSAATKSEVLQLTLGGLNDADQQ